MPMYHAMYLSIYDVPMINDYKRIDDEAIATYSAAEETGAPSGFPIWLPDGREVAR